MSLCTWTCRLLREYQQVAAVLNYMYGKGRTGKQLFKERRWTQNRKAPSTLEQYEKIAFHVSPSLFTPLCDNALRESGHNCLGFGGDRASGSVQLKFPPFCFLAVSGNVVQLLPYSSYDACISGSHSINRNTHNTQLKKPNKNFKSCWEAFIKILLISVCLTLWINC